MNRSITNPAIFGKVAVLMGGNSAEREISLETGNAVYQALCRVGVDAHCLDAQGNYLMHLVEEKFERVFVALHGRGGEDGIVQGALELLNIPYTGSNVLGAALTMDKVRTKWVWQSQGIPTPEFLEIHTRADLDRVSGELGFPVFMKPVHEGSSCGAAKITQQSELAAAWDTALAYDTRVMVERWIEGAEITASILTGEVLPLIRIETPRVFYDYQAKYLDDSTRYFCPCGLPEPDEQRIAAQALHAFEVSGGGGWGRVDLLMDSSGASWFIEVNTVPGMTSHSLVPMAARAAGMDFDTLVVRILETSVREEQRTDSQRVAS